MLALNKPNGGFKGTTRVYITQCKVCALSVFADEPHEWFSKPLGISHNACIESQRKV